MNCGDREWVCALANDFILGTYICYMLLSHASRFELRQATGRGLAEIHMRHPTVSIFASANALDKGDLPSPLQIFQLARDSSFDELIFLDCHSRYSVDIHPRSSDIPQNV
jgi:hypothetical protein